MDLEGNVLVCKSRWQEVSLKTWPRSNPKCAQSPSAWLSCCVCGPQFNFLPVNHSIYCQFAECVIDWIIGKKKPRYHRLLCEHNSSNLILCLRAVKLSCPTLRKPTFICCPSENKGSNGIEQDDTCRYRELKNGRFVWSVPWTESKSETEREDVRRPSQVFPMLFLIHARSWTKVWQGAYTNCSLSVFSHQIHIGTYSVCNDIHFPNCAIASA